MNLEPSNSHFEITGTHDIDLNWINYLKREGLKVVPRLIFSNMRGNHYISIIQNVTVTAQILDLVLDAIHAYKFDGIVLELGVFIH